MNPKLWLHLLGLILLSTAAPAAAQQATAIPPGDQPLSGGIYSALEGHLAREFEKSIGPADRWEVHLSRSGNDLATGRIGRIDVDGVNVRTPQGLVIGVVTIRIDDLKMNLGSGYIEDIGDASFLGRLEDEEVERFARAQDGGPLGDLRISFHGDGIRVSGITQVLGIGVRVQVTGRPRLSENVISFELDRVSIAHLRMPGSIERRIERRINPVGDFARLNLPAKITSVEIDDHHLIARGVLVFQRDEPPPAPDRSGATTDP